MDKMYLKCKEWIGDVDDSNITLVHSEDEGTYHQRIYLAVWNDDDGYTHIYVIRVFTGDEYKNINLSEDYSNTVLISDLANWISEIIEYVKVVSN